MGGFAQLGTVDLGQVGPPDISPDPPIDQQRHVPQPGMQSQRPYDAVGIGFDQRVADLNAPRLSHVPPIGGQSQGLKAAVASTQPLARQQAAVAGRIDKKGSREAVLGRGSHLYLSAVGRQADRLDRLSLTHLHAGLPGVVQQQGVKIRPPDLKAAPTAVRAVIGGARFGFAPAHRMAGDGQKAGPLNLGTQVQKVKNGQDARGERLADLVAGKRVSFQHHDPQAIVRQQAGYRCPSRTAAGHDHIAMRRRCTRLSHRAYHIPLADRSLIG